MRSTVPSTIADARDLVPEEVERAFAAAGFPETRVARILWVGRAAAVRNTLTSAVVDRMEAEVSLELNAMRMPEVFYTSVGVLDRVVLCDLDAKGTASIFAVVDSAEYSDLVEDAGEDALFGVDLDGIYVDRSRTRH